MEANRTLLPYSLPGLKGSVRVLREEIHITLFRGKWN
jgi:hypothetical protein